MSVPRRVAARAATALGAAMLGGCAGDPAPVGPAPIVLVSLDTFRADRLGVLGNPRGLTPNLDAFAAESVVFSHAWSQADSTSMSHASLFTSHYPSELGDIGPAFRQDPDHPTLAEVLRGQAYATAAFTGGGQLIPGSGLERGFTLFEAAHGLGSFWHSVPPALTWLDTLGRGPFFLFVHSSDTHAPYRAPPPYGLAWTDPERVGTAHEADLYDGAAAYADAGFGGLIAGLQEQGIYDRAVIVAFADHGESLGEDGRFGHGDALSDAVLHVPLIVHAPGAPPGTIRSPVGLLDVMPTVLELAGVPVPAGLAGHSLAPWLRGKTGPTAAAAFAESASRAISVRTNAGRVTFAGISADTPPLADLLQNAAIDGPAFARDTTVDDLATRRALRTRLLAWRKELHPAPAEPTDAPRTPP